MQIRAVIEARAANVLNPPRCSRRVEACSVGAQPAPCSRSLSRLVVRDWAVHWLDTQTHLKPLTRERYAGILREHVIPRWGSVRLSEVSHGEVQSWVTLLARTLSPASVRKVHRVLSLILSMAVRDGRLARNVATGVHLPRVVKAERQYLTHDEVERLANACA